MSQTIRSKKVFSEEQSRTDGLYDQLNGYTNPQVLGEGLSVFWWQTEEKKRKRVGESILIFPLTFSLPFSLLLQRFS